MSNGYEIYKVITSLNIHFSQPDYHYGKNSLIVPKLETYYSDKNYNIYEGLGRYDRQYIENLYLSNCLHTNGYVNPLQLKNMTSHKIKEKWEETISIADQLFLTELFMIMEKHEFENPYDLFRLIKEGTNNISETVYKKVENILEVIDDKIENKIDINNEIVNELCGKDIHFVVILDEIMKRYFRYSFLESFAKSVSHPMFFALKYKECLPMFEIMKENKIKLFCECL